jgi:membrane protease YdiL (CAAX protease family)
MIDITLIIILVIIATVLLWTVILFKIVMSPFAINNKWKLLGVLLIFALCYSMLPSWAVKTFNFKSYTIPCIIVSVLFVGLVILYTMINARLKKYI